MCNPGLNEVEDASLVFADPGLQNSLQFLRKDNLALIEGSKYHTEEAEGEGRRETVTGIQTATRNGTTRRRFIPTVEGMPLKASVFLIHP